MTSEDFEHLLTRDRLAARTEYFTAWTYHHMSGEGVREIVRILSLWAYKCRKCEEPSYLHRTDPADLTKRADQPGGEEIVGASLAEMVINGDLEMWWASDQDIISDFTELCCDFDE